MPPSEERRPWEDPPSTEAPGPDPELPESGPEPGDAPPPGAEPEGGGPLAGKFARLSAAAVAVWTLEGVWALLLAVLAGGAQPTIGAAILAFVVAANAVRYLRFEWRLEPESLIIHQGLIRLHRRVIPRDRIHSVDLERKVRHRMFGVVEVRVETMGGGGETEGTLAALDPATAEELRRRLLTGNDQPGATEVQADADPDEGLEELARVPARRLVVAAVTGGRVGVGAAIVAAALQVMPEEWVERAARLGAEEGPEWVAAGGIRLILLFVLVALLAGFALSLVATVTAYWDFSLSRDERTLRVRRGLLTLRRDTVPFRRIQAVRVEENIVRRWLGLAAVQVTVAGRAGEQVEDTGLILPIGDRMQAFRLARLVASHPGEGAPSLQPMPSGARARRFVRATAVAVVTAGLLYATAAALAVAAGEVERPEVLPALVALALLAAVGFPLALVSYRNLGWYDDGTHFVVSEGLANRRTSFVEVNRIQEVETTATPFQRRRSLATLRLGIPRPLGAGRTPRALDLGDAEAGRLREALAARIRRPRGSRT